VRFGESYVQFSLARGCTSVNMFTFESDDELHQGQRGYSYLGKTATSVGRWPGSRKLDVGLHVAAKRRPHPAPAQARRPMIDDDAVEARVRALTTVLALARNSTGGVRAFGS
jgi:hypothetical protein